MIHYESHLRTRGYEADRTATLPLPVYLQHMENMRWEWLLDAEAGFLPLMHEGYFFVVLRQSFELVRRIGLGVDVHLLGRIHHVGRSTVNVEHRMIRVSDGALVAQAMVVGAFLGPNRRLARVPEHLREQARTSEALDAVPTSDWSSAPAPEVLCAKLSASAFSRINPPERVYPPLGVDQMQAPKGEPPADAFVHRRTVWPSEIDIFDHVNAATYLHYMEDARILAAGAGVLTPGAADPSRRVCLAYDKQALVGDELEIRVWPGLEPESWFSEVRRAGGDRLCRAQMDGLAFETPNPSTLY